MLIFLDVQTTGVEPDDVICSIALEGENNLIYELINEGKKIPTLVSSIHNITNEMIKGKSGLKQSNIYTVLEKYNKKENTLVGHNINFDLEKLAALNIIWNGEIIDTMKVSKHLIEECDLFSLNYLRYELKLYKQEKELKAKYGIKDALVAHNAQSNVLLTKLLFDYLHEMSEVDTMKELSNKKVLLQKLTFGKYQGRYIEEIVDQDRAYLQWMLGLSEIDEDLKYSLEYYL
ncbi:exodeoxyribonuclease X C-terminal domain-containing protein [Sulfurimonas sp.]